MIVTDQSVCLTLDTSANNNHCVKDMINQGGNESDSRELKEILEFCFQNILKRMNSSAPDTRFVGDDVEVVAESVEVVAESVEAGFGESEISAERSDQTVSSDERGIVEQYERKAKRKMLLKRQLWKTMRRVTHMERRRRKLKKWLKKILKKSSWMQEIFQIMTGLHGSWLVGGNSIISSETLLAHKGIVKEKRKSEFSEIIRGGALHLTIRWKLFT